MIPSELQQLNHWLVWKTYKGSKPSFDFSGNFATVTNNRTWLSFELANQVLKRGYEGLTFALFETEFVIVDLDDCVINGVITEFAQKIINFFDSYTEISASGTGVHIIIKITGKKPYASKKKFRNLDTEIICNWCGVTGNCIRNSELIADRTDELNRAIVRLTKLAAVSPVVAYEKLNCADYQVIEKMRKSKKSSFLMDLYEGRLPLLDKSKAEARQDFLLAKNLLYWCNGDESQVMRLMLQSGLKRNFWENDNSYLSRTIQNAKK